MSSNNNKSVLLNFLLHLHPVRVPESSAKFIYTFGLGGLTLFSFLVTALTGSLLVFVYSPTPESANPSMQYIATVMPYGWYIRNLHYWAAQTMVIAAVLHMIRIVLNGGYKRGRPFNWVIGIALLVLIFLMDFTGYSLRWDVESYHAVVAGINLLREVPVIGESICSLIAGGSEITGSTLLRLYGWHITGLPLVTFTFMVYHFYRIRKDGNTPEKDTTGLNIKTISRVILLKKEIIFLLLTAGLLTALSAIVTPRLGVSAEMNMALLYIQAPWIFLAVQFLLRYLPPFIAGIIIPCSVLIYWTSVPYMDRSHRTPGIWFAAERVKYWLPFILSILIIAAFMLAELIL